MFCIIQEIENKKVSYYPTSKNIEAYEVTYTIDGIAKTYYSFRRSTEKYTRPIKKAYKISIHRSYRENGKVIKKQWVICTMSYYELLGFWPGDCTNSKTLKKKLGEMNISEETLWGMVYQKLDPLIKKIKAEFAETEEYKAQQEQEKIIDKYQKDKTEFEEKYGKDTYDYCFDVFGILRNIAYFTELKTSYEAQQQYKKSSYHRSNYSNYSWNECSGFGINANYSEEEKAMAEEIIKQGFKVLSKRYHPDVSDIENATELFQRLGNLKDKLLETVKK